MSVAGALVSGSSGFIGSHLCPRLAGGQPPGASAIGVDLVPRTYAGAFTLRVADIRDRAALEPVGRAWTGSTVIHLAALAEVVMPYSALGELAATNVSGTVNLLRALEPERMVFASSCAVYGNVRTRPAPPRPGATRNLGAYGVSKTFAEVACGQWCHERGRTAVILRLGNVIGPRCRGLIPYLVEHAVRHPDGSRPARLRGDGRIVRDYVPVAHVVDCLLAAARFERRRPGLEILNVGSGRGLSNAEVAGAVAEILRARGYRLALDFGAPVSWGEARSVALDVDATARRLGVSPPGRAEVDAAVEAAVHDWLASFETGDAAAPG